MEDFDFLIAKYGENHRQLIQNALDFLDQNEAGWNLDVPIDREEYIKILLSKISEIENK